MSNKGDSEEEKKVSYEGELNKEKPKNYYERMENTLSNNQIYDEIKAFVGSGEKNDEFESNIWFAKGDQWAIDRTKIRIQHQEAISEMRPKLFNSILGRLKYACDDNSHLRIGENLRLCGIYVINYLMEHFNDPNALLYLFNMSRGLADGEKGMNSFIDEVIRMRKLPKIHVKPEEESVELKNLRTMAFYFYKLILETPLVYNAIASLFAEEVNKMNGYDYNFRADNSNHLDKILRHYREIKVVITDKLAPFDGMAGRDN